MPKTLESGLEAVFNSGVLGPGADALYRQGRYAELGLEILSTVGPGLAAPAGLDTDRRKSVLVATGCLRSAGALAAGHLLFALGMRRQAEEMLDREGLATRVEEVAGEWSLAALMPQGNTSSARMPHLRAVGDLARSLGQHLRAASFYEWGAMPYEAALSRLAGRDESGALSLLLRVRQGGPLYRRACLRAISLAAQLDLSSPELEAFLEPFISGAVLDDDDARAVYLWARHLWNRTFGQAAGKALRKLIAARPNHAAAKELLAQIEQAEPAAHQGGRILEAEASFRGRDRVEETRPLRDAPQPKPRYAPPPLPPAPDLPDPLAVWQQSTLPHLGTVAPRTLDQGAVSNSTPPEGRAAGTGLFVLAPGLTIAGRYRLGAKLGRGGTAVVFQATDLEMREEIAIKIFVSHELDPAMNERFKRELRLSRQLSHPDILRLYDLGFFEGHLYITMELLMGSTLRQRLSNGRVDIATALGYLRQLCDGLQAMHDLGIVHRDLKPENLFVTRSDRIKIMDLGIAKKMAASNLTSHGWLWGTPRYMSPEQINDFSRVTASADLYSLGIVAYEMLTGVVPFDHPEVESVMVMQLRELPAPPRKLNPQVPPELEALVLQLLEKSPERRPKTCREVRGQLEAAGQRRRAPGPR